MSHLSCNKSKLGTHGGGPWVAPYPSQSTGSVPCSFLAVNPLKRRNVSERWIFPAAEDPPKTARFVKGPGRYTV